MYRILRSVRSDLSPAVLSYPFALVTVVTDREKSMSECRAAELGTLNNVGSTPVTAWLQQTNRLVTANSVEKLNDIAAVTDGDSCDSFFKHGAPVRTGSRPSRSERGDRPTVWSPPIVEGVSRVKGSMVIFAVTICHKY